MRARIPLASSSALVAVFYDSDTAILEVEFRQGEVYRYFMVPQQVVTDLAAAESAGHYFGERIRSRYREERVR